MTGSADDPFIKVFRAERDEVDLWDNDVTLAWWVRLRIMADAAWPAAADLPRVPQKTLAALAAAGQVDVIGSRFRCPAIDAERATRQQKGAEMAAARWKRRKVGDHA